MDGVIRYAQLRRDVVFVFAADGAVGNDPKGLYLLDQEYAARVYTAPSLVL